VAYGSASGVARYCKNILGPEQTFSESSCPSIKDVKGWLSGACAVIETCLANRGYSVPVAAGNRVYDWLADLGELYGAARVELSRTNVTLGPGERTRGQVFDEQFWNQLDRLCKNDLTQLGVGKSGTGARIYVGGISQTEKDRIIADTDLVAPRFSRNLFRFPDTVDPTAKGAS